jgi:hypothetical protein
MKSGKRELGCRLAVLWRKALEILREGDARNEVKH